mgnify:CR=1 FL=1
MQEIAICDLKPSKENVRKTKASDESMERLIASIKSKGLLKNLVVKKNGTGYFVTDGNRRLQALQEIYGSNSGEAISCKILDDDANELEIGLHANTMHEHMHPLDECEAIDHIVEGGEMDYSGIALQFGQTERWVAQRVGLSQLSPLAKEKFRAMEFGISVAEALTIGDHKSQDKFLKSNKNKSFDAKNVTWALTSNKVKVSKAIYDWETHQSELGIEKDLFSEEIYITNQKAHEKLTKKFLDDLVKKEEKKGYIKVILLVDEQTYNHPALKNLEYSSHTNKTPKTQYLCIQYTNYNGVLDKTKYQLKEKSSSNGSGPVSVDFDGRTIDVPESDNPKQYSRPQQVELEEYKNEYLRIEAFRQKNNFKSGKFALALLAYNSLTKYGSIGWGSITDRSHFPGICLDEEKRGSYKNDIDKYLELVIKDCNESCEANGTSALSYYINLDDDKLNEILYVCFIQSFQSQDIQSDEFQSIYKVQEEPEYWFTPEKSWLNKYSTAKLLKLYEIVFKDQCPISKKKEIVDAIYNRLQEHGGFDPQSA